MTRRNEGVLAEREIAERYIRDGYEVVASPPKGSLPVSLRGFELDLIARRGDQTVVVEVKRSSSAAARAHAKALAEVIAGMPGWRFDFVVVPRQERKRPPLELEDIVRRLDAAAKIAGSTSDAPAAVLLAWTAIEAILRFKLGEEAANERSPHRLAKQALSLGLVSNKEYDRLARFAETRNAVVHGKRAARVTERTAREAIALGKVLIDRQDNAI